MSERLTVDQYFRTPETLERTELVNGFVVREPAAPRYDHQAIVTRLTMFMTAHVRARGLGEVCVSPVDVVLDEPNALVVQPDIVFVSHERRHIIRDRIWGAPDLVVEVLSTRTGRRDRTTKVGWYARYGIRECWLVEPDGAWIEVVPLHGGARTLYHGAMVPRSTVLSAWDLPAEHLFS